MADITSCINTEEGGRRIKGRVGIRIEVRVKVRVKVRVRVKLKVKPQVKVDRGEKGKTDLLIRVRISSTTQTTSLENIDTLFEEANTSTTTTTKRPMIRKKRMTKKTKRRRTKNHVSSAQKRSNITLEVFVGTRLASEYTSMITISPPVFSEGEG
jgi:hypothetical protein